MVEGHHPLWDSKQGRRKQLQNSGGILSRFSESEKRRALKGKQYNFKLLVVIFNWAIFQGN